MLSDILSCLQLTQCFLHVTSDGIVMDLQCLDHAVRIDDESAAQCQAFLIDVYAESTCQLVSWVTDQRELRLTNCWRGFMPNLVREVCICSNDVHFSTQLLEFSVILSCIFNFSRAVESKGCWHKDHNRPFTLQVSFSHFDKLTVMESLSLERLYLCID